MGNWKNNLSCKIANRAEECVENIQRITVSSLHGRKKAISSSSQPSTKQVVGN